ncbi:MAG: DNA replication and repair protein RecF [Armatimonadetes bacterium]|nr:DNA replication and repair protein RecF [Armatimonadota bacterium]
MTSSFFNSGLEPNETSIRVDMGVGKRKRGLVNRIALKRASDLMGRLPCVAFTNEDLAILRGEPTDRRAFLDTTLCQLFPAYLGHLAAYKRALEQRNALLKFAQDQFVGVEQFESWEEELAVHGAGLRSLRASFIGSLRGPAEAIHSEMSGGESFVLSFLPKEDRFSREELLGAYAVGRGYEIQRGSTQVGPHRDDLGLTVGGREARAYGSQGQQRTAAISLKLATLGVMTDHLGSAPILLLDDVFSELDASRRSRMLETAATHTGQVVLTCTEAEQAGIKVLESSTVFRVQSGVVHEEAR